MSRKLKVYGWVESVKECPPASNGSRQARIIVATTSWREAARLSGSNLSFISRMGCTTRNTDAVAAAMAQPGVALWTDRRWTSAPVYHVLQVRPAAKVPLAEPFGFQVLPDQVLPDQVLPDQPTETPARELQYIVTSNAWYGPGAMFRLRKDNINEEIQFGSWGPPPDEADVEGSWTAFLTWHFMGAGLPLVCRLAAFDDAWNGLYASGALAILESDPLSNEPVTVDTMAAALDNLGFRDVTPTEEPPSVQRMKHGSSKP